MSARAISLEGHGDDVYRIAFFPDSSRVITACLDNIARVFDADTGALIFPFVAHKAAICALAVLGTDLVATGDRTGVICIWDARTECCLSRAEHGGAVLSLALLSPSRFVAGLDDGTLLFFHHCGGKDVTVSHSHLDAHSDGIYCIAAHGERLVTGSWDLTAKVWDVDSREVLAALCGHANYVDAVAISAKHVVTTSSALVRVWDSETFALLYTLDKHTKDIDSALIVGNSHLLTASHDKTIVLFDLATAGSTIYAGILDFWILSAVVTSDGRIAACGEDNSAVVFRPPQSIARVIRAPAAAAALRILGYHSNRSDRSFYANSAEVRSWRAAANLPFGL